ncbi:hypothetical protein AMATHDRAFT_156059 [Amanita thiersii Skay4041]|uniref:HIT-type domain-containing protein n=1 Tax=Amanita thiersii Skay4041 TaxID=703135 RepID=A0A2A9N7Q9_9AGAR|nr:hypothetical protein AMATHDRAFT_156059 [Amanita thiersii Skay4041]
MPTCDICSSNQSKYTCSTCFILYCSVPCYKQHKGEVLLYCQPQPSEAVAAYSSPSTREALRPLTSLKWPYAPEESAYPDPLKRDDPKALQLPQYEAIATSPSIRAFLASHPNLPALLTSIDKLKGVERERALSKALGVTASDMSFQAQPSVLSEDVLALREFAEVVEAAVRGDNTSALGLNWGDDS